MRDARELTYAEWKAWFRRRNEPSYRAEQVFRWLYQKEAAAFEEMTDLGSALRSKLASELDLYWPRLDCLEESPGEPGVKKYLWRMSDGAAVEAVRLPYRHWVSVCLSSQVGCRLGCKFCETGRGGWRRNLTAGEMLSQWLAISRDCRQRGETPPSRVVVMGMGEPLDNLPELARFLQILTHRHGVRMSPRRVTVSTAGLVPGIYELARLGWPVNLALSLHAADDTARERLMPINRLYPVDQVLRAGDYYVALTGRRVMVEYTLLAGFNDDRGEAEKLARKLRNRLVLVNVIPANPVDIPGVEPASDQAIGEFVDLLERAGVSVTRRRELGTDIKGACGQLRGELED